MPRPRSDPAHGTRNRYQLRRDPCRCSDCKKASAAYQRAWRNHVSAAYRRAYLSWRDEEARDDPSWGEGEAET